MSGRRSRGLHRIEGFALAGLPLFASPVLDSPALATRLRGLHTALLRGADPLERDELLSGTIAALVRLAARRPPEPPATARAATATCLAAKARELIHDCYTEPINADDLAAWTGSSRYAVYRAFRATDGLAPSDYQRQLRLRAARRLLARGARGPCRERGRIHRPGPSHSLVHPLVRRHARPIPHG